MRGVGSERKASTQLRQTAAKSPQQVLPYELWHGKLAGTAAYPIPPESQARHNRTETPQCYYCATLPNQSTRLRNALPYIRLVRGKGSGVRRPQRRRMEKMDQSEKSVTISAVLSRSGPCASCLLFAGRLVYQAVSPARTDEEELGAHDSRVEKLPALPCRLASSRRSGGEMALSGLRHPLHLPKQPAGGRFVAGFVAAGADDPPRGSRSRRNFADRPSHAGAARGGIRRQRGRNGCSPSACHGRRASG
jgi:hypothetical protein